MADKSFGVKELNLFGSSGTPTIDSPNDLNLNASTVAISTNLTVGNKLSISAAGIVTSISGIITYYGDGSHLTGISAATGAVKCLSTKNFVTESTCSGCNFSGAEHNIIFGECAGKLTSSGRRNVFLGLCAGHYNASADDNIYIGTCAGKQDIGGYNIAFGYRASENNTGGGDYNISIGYYAGACSHTNYNIFIGEAAGTRVCGNTNIAIGRRAMYASATNSNNTGSYNVAFGFCGGYNLTTGSKNVLIGMEAGDNLTSGCCNVVIGYNTDPASSTGNSQFIIGNGGNKWICGDSNYNIYDKDGNQLNGAGGGGFSPDARQNLISGYNAGKCLDGTYASNNILLGCDTGCCVTSGCYNIGFGWRSLQGNSSAVTGSCNIAMGRDAGRCITSSVNNVFLGTETGRGNSSVSGNNNVAFGTYALQQLTSGQLNFSALSYSGCEISSGNSNITIGEYAGSSITSGSGNTLLGNRAGCQVTGNYVVAIGSCAGKCHTSNDNTVYIGHQAGCNLNATNSVIIGYCAGRGCASGCSAAENTIVGCFAGRYISTGSLNAFYGASAGCKNTSGTCNTNIGADAGRSITTGSQNTTLGFRAAPSLETGSHNVAIGYCAKLDSTSGNKQFVIGCVDSHWICGDSNFNIYDKDGNQINGGGGGGGGTPGGSNTQVQYNSSGSFAGSSNLTFDGTHLTVGGCVNASSVASSANGLRKITSSTSSPSGGSDGDIWIKYTA